MKLENLIWSIWYKPATYVEILTIFSWTCTFSHPQPPCGLTKFQFQNLYSTNLENLKEMDTFLDSAKSPKLNQGEFSNLIRPMTNETETVIKNSLQA